MKHAAQIAWYRDDPHRVHRLRGIDYDLRVTVRSILHIYPLDRLRDPDHVGVHVDVLPFQGTYLSDPEACAQADVYTQVHGTVVLLEMTHDPLLGIAAQYLYLLPLSFRRELHIYFMMLHQSVLHGILDTSVKVDREHALGSGRYSTGTECIAEAVVLDLVAQAAA